MVSRGTLPTVRALSLAPYEHDALVEGDLVAIRRPITEENSRVHPGMFRGLDFDSGRARRMSAWPELRARCRFDSGAERAVTVSSAYRQADLFWLRAPGRHPTRDESKWTLELWAIDIARVQDMGDAQALEYGAGHLLEVKGANNAPRARYSRAWDTWHTQREKALRWHSNPWCWNYRFNAWKKNVDDILEDRKP